MDAQTPRTRMRAAEAAAADQATPRSARGAAAASAAAGGSGGEAGDPASLRKESLMASTRTSPRAPSPPVFGGTLNLKQLAAAAAAAAATPGGSGPSTPRGARAKDGAAAVAAGGSGSAALAPGRSPRGGDQTPGRRAAVGDDAGAAPSAAAPPALAPAPAPAPARLGDGDNDEQAGPGGDEATVERPTPAAARAAPLLHAEGAEHGEQGAAAGAAGGHSTDGATAAGTGAAGLLTAGSLRFWRARSSAGNAPTISIGGAVPARRVTGPGGLTAAELLLMDARRPSRADSEDADALLHRAQPHPWHGARCADGPSGSAGGGAPGVDPIGEEGEAAVAAVAAAAAAASPVAATATAVAAPPPAAPASPPPQHRRTLLQRARPFVQPAIIALLAVALVVTMVHTFAP